MVSLCEGLKVSLAFTLSIGTLLCEALSFLTKLGTFPCQRLEPKLIFTSVLMYNSPMDLHSVAREVLLEDAINRDRITARRAALLQILQQERYLTREQLIVRVEGMLGTGCFGESAWIDTFYRDMKVVKRALRIAGYQVAYSRRVQRPGYYLRDQPSIGSDLSNTLDRSVTEVDPMQMAIFKQLSIRQRFQQGCSISDLARNVVAYRLRERNPHLGLVEAHRQATQKGHDHE
jgi:hypothetical protein